MKAEELKDRFGKITIQDKKYLLVEEKVLQSLLDEAAQLPKKEDEFGPVDLTDVEPDRIRLPKEGEEAYVPCPQAEGDIQLPYRTGGIIALKKVTLSLPTEEEIEAVLKKSLIEGTYGTITSKAATAILTLLKDKR